MNLLTVNTGSTSVKLTLFELGPCDRLVAGPTQQHSVNENPSDVLRGVEQCGFVPRAIAHRIVHGGDRFARPARINDEVVTAIDGLSALAPLHNRAALRWVGAARELWPSATHVAVFDTSFFVDLPRVAAEYAVPTSLGLDHGIRRYGFHGLAHQAMWQGWCRLRPDLPQGGRLISLQLGGGCSITALQDGRPLDTSMGFSPLEGLVMATRSGDIDPAIVPHLERQLGVSSEVILSRLNEQSGLLGLSGTHDNPAALLADPAPQARFAVELYCYRIRKYVGAFLAVLGGCDGIVFGGGVGEHVPGVRARALSGLSWAGISLDPKANEAARGGSACISPARASVAVHVLAADEESVLARAAAALLTTQDSQMSAAT